MPKPKYGQIIAINEGLGAGFPYVFEFPFDDVGSAFKGQPADITTGFIDIIRTDGPTFGGRRVRNTRTFGSLRIANATV